MKRISLGPLLIAALTISYFSFGWGRVLPSLSIAAIFLFIAFFVSIVKYGLSFHKISVLSICLAFFLLFLIFLINDFYIPFFRIRDFSIILLVFTVFYNFFKNESEANINFILKIIIFYLSFSSFIAFFQSLNFDFSWNIRSFLPSIQDMAVSYQIENRIRPAGLSYYSVQLSYQLLIGLISVDIASIKNRFFKKHKFKFFTFILLGGLFGANLSLILASLIYFALRFTLSSRKISLVGILTIAALLVLIIISPTLDRLIFIDASSLSRITFLYIGLNILFMYPFGVSYDEIYEIKSSFIFNMDSNNLPMADKLLETSFHNSFLSIGIETGIIGMILYILFYLYLLIFYFKGFVSKKNYLEQIYLIGFCGNFAYLAQLISHNAGPLHSDPYFWMINGILIGYLEFIKRPISRSS